MKQHKIDIMMIQETRSKKFERDARYNIIETRASPKKDNNYVTSGMKIITRRDIPINLDSENTTKFLLIANVKPNLKIINVYA